MFAVDERAHLFTDCIFTYITVRIEKQWIPRNISGVFLFFFWLCFGQSEMISYHKDKDQVLIGRDTFLRYL